MFDIGWVEMMVVVVVMIVVIGPKDLPAVLHTMGKWIAHVRAMARSFQNSIEEMAQEAGLDELRDDVRSIRDFSLEDEIDKAVDPEGELKEGIAGNSAKAIESGDNDSGDGKGEGASAAAEEEISKPASVEAKPESRPEPGVAARSKKA